MASPLCGVFIGGQSRRMGGRPKGLLPAPDTGEPLVLRLVRMARELGLEVRLVGESPAFTEPARALSGLSQLTVVPDQPPGIGPLGGLHALLAEAVPRDVVVLACDLPYVSAALLARLVPTLQPGIDARVPRRGAGEGWEPLCARYGASALPVLRQALTDGVRSFHGLLLRLRVEALELDAAEQRGLVDWDSPEDVEGRERAGPRTSTSP